MFQSIYHEEYSVDLKRHFYNLKDSEFGSSIVPSENGITEVTTRAITMIKEYQRRNLPIVENIAIFNIWYHKKYMHPLHQIKEWQDQDCPEYIDNWSTISQQVDNLINKYLLLQ